ncbi:hypothetical protein SAMN05443999_101247 [Roseovarius azorensis]|uniref:Uncharacterized protein n=1 Tax=Roseovarius azorensis TaxID=1287727 RepID=A0A1H7G7H8_9RHOB|nr:hypothetical protein [Roseovarius azorensis]SEK34099.1 hypothetical protein SAMN05443999_101247 [Roseovarius azorensis]
MAYLLTEPKGFSRQDYEDALRDAEALPDDDPDKTEIVAARKKQLEIMFGPARRRSPEERRAILRAFLDDPAP